MPRYQIRQQLYIQKIINFLQTILVTKTVHLMIVNVFILYERLNFQQILIKFKLFLGSYQNLLNLLS